MYTVYKEYRKIADKRRRQWLHKYEVGKKSFPKEWSRASFNVPEEKKQLNNFPRPLFHQSSKQSSIQKKTDQAAKSSYQEDLINYIKHSWDGLNKKVSNSVESTTTTISGDANEVYEVWIEPSSLELQKFEAFDLESWWSNRLYMKATKDL